LSNQYEIILFFAHIDKLLRKGKTLPVTAVTQILSQAICRRRSSREHSWRDQIVRNGLWCWQLLSNRISDSQLFSITVDSVVVTAPPTSTARYHTLQLTHQTFAVEATPQRRHKMPTPRNIYSVYNLRRPRHAIARQ